MPEKIVKKTWEEFQEAGMLWYINRILHVFGWSIVVVPGNKDDHLFSAYPARVRFRGFLESSETLGFHKVTQFLKENIDALQAEVEE